MTPETARFLLDLVNAQTLNVGASDFDEVVGLVQAARRDLQKMLDD